MNIETFRPGMTVLPDQIDEATGERIEGSAEVVDTKHVAFHNQAHELSPEGEPEFVGSEFEDDDYLAPEDRENELLAIGEISSEINETTIIPDDEFADSIASYQLGDSPAEVTCQYLVYKVYAGDISPEDALTEAMSSGIPTNELVSAWNRLKKAFS